MNRESTKLERYKILYRLHLQNYNLADDSDTILENDLIFYVENEIGIEDKAIYEHHIIN